WFLSRNAFTIAPKAKGPRAGYALEEAKERVSSGTSTRVFRAWTAGVCSLFCTVIVTGQDIDVSKLPAPAARRVDFVKDIQPVLERSCLKCHNATVSMSGLRLDNREEALKGGDLGVDIVPGHSAESRAIHFAGRLVPQLEM